MFQERSVPSAGPLRKYRIRVGRKEDNRKEEWGMFGKYQESGLAKVQSK